MLTGNLTYLAAVSFERTAVVNLLATANATSAIKGGELPYWKKYKGYINKYIITFYSNYFLCLIPLAHQSSLNHGNFLKKDKKISSCGKKLIQRCQSYIPPWQCTLLQMAPSQC